ncbi:DUF4382 domain-containing protein [Halalkaliarchaeum sp. AArc-GB]|uniref:DUF4382 domain-containing protein n=1 Tax=Halalkaliarchaeum sp. AArc-GB TaxID=3074078 RepID=UPI00285BCC3A|nr:DUF4382 domain-containing protein [Halalkaliarchaeum sp. AArc-GB]MDR5672708.1 DUF4382 domain-containing protein [Halalkaliarchaeum sp. AArc-GB]
MYERDHLLDRRTYLKATGGIAAVGSAGLAGCVGDDASGGATGTLATRVTDQPGDIGDFESCIVTIEGLWVKPAGVDEEDDEGDDGNDGDNDEGNDENNDEDEEETPDLSEAREYHEFDEPQEADLVQLQDGETQLVDEQELAAREYEFLQLEVTDVDGTLADGGDADVSTPGNAPLQFKHRFEIREAQRTVFTADFTPVRRGATGSYLLQPVAQGTTVEYEDVEDEEDDSDGDADGDADDDQ